MSKPKNDDPQYSRPDIDTVLLANKSLISGIHPACAAVPVIDDQDFQRLVASIEADGLLEPIRVNEDREVLDGQSRACAMFALGRPLQDSQVIVTDQPAEAIAESNFARRHLTPDQKAMRAVRDLQQTRAGAAKRQQEALEKKPQNSTKNTIGAVATEFVATKSKRREPSLNAVAKEQKVSRAKLAQAERLEKSNPDLAKQVESGQLSLGVACAKAGLEKPPTERTPSKKSRSKKPQVKPTGHDERTAVESDVVPHSENGIQVVKYDAISIYADVDFGKQIVTYPDGDGWIVATIGTSQRVRAKSSARAARRAMKWINDNRTAMHGDDDRKVHSSVIE